MAKTATPAVTKDFDHTFMVWIVILFALTFGYVGKGSLPIGMGLLSFMYVISWIFLYKWVSSKNDFKFAFDGVKGAFDAFMKGNGNNVNYLLIFFILFVVGVSITFLYGGNKVPNSNEWWISADVFLSIIVLMVGFMLWSNTDIVTIHSFYGLCAIFVGIVIWNFVNLAKVTDIIAKRSALIGTYNMGSGNLSKTSLDLMTGFLVLFYALIVFLIALVYFSMPGYQSFWMIIVSLLGAIGATIGNHFLTKEIIERVPNERAPSKKEKERDASQEKIQNQNIFTNAYYSFLRFFNDPEFM
jgi:hypothetical protein